MPSLTPFGNEDDLGSTLHPLDDLFNVLGGGDVGPHSEDTVGDGVYPSFSDVQIVWREMCGRLGIDRSVLSGGLGDDDEPATDALMTRTCPHLQLEVMSGAGTTWVAFGGASLRGESPGGNIGLKLDPALRNCFCSQRCVECPPTADVAAALAVAATKSKGTTSSSGTAAATSSTPSDLDQGATFHGHCLGCLGEFLGRKQCDSHRVAQNAPAEYYPCLCFPPLSNENNATSTLVDCNHLVAHFRYHEEQATLALDELDARDDDDSTVQSGSDQDDLLCVTNEAASHYTKDELEQLATYHRQHCIYSFAMGSANTPIQVLYCAPCNLFAPICRFIQADTTVPTDTVADNKAPHIGGASVTRFVASDSASIVLYKLLLVAHVAQTVSTYGRTLNPGDEPCNGEQDNDESSDTSRPVDPPPLSHEALRSVSEKVLSAGSARLFLFKPCVLSPLRYVNPTENDEVILALLEADQRVCDDINDSFFSDAVDFVYEAWGPVSLNSTALANKGQGGDCGVQVSCTSRAITPMVETVAVTTCRPTTETGVDDGVVTDLVEMLYSGHQATAARAEGSSSTAVGFVVCFKSADDVEKAVSTVNERLLERGLGVWGYTSADTIANHRSTTPASRPSVQRYLRSIAQTPTRNDSVVGKEMRAPSTKPPTVSIPVLQAKIVTSLSRSTPLVHVPRDEPVSHPEIDFIEVVDGDGAAPSAHLIPTQLLQFEVMFAEVQLTGLVSPNGLLGVAVEMLIVPCPRRPSNVDLPNPLINFTHVNVKDLDGVEDESLRTFLVDVEGMRMAEAEDPATDVRVAMPTLTSLATLSDDVIEPKSVAARALGELAVAGGCPLSQPAANLQLLNTVATVARVFSAAWLLLRQ